MDTTLPRWKAPCDTPAGLRRPVVVHCVTRKGMGYPPAEQDDTDHLHIVGIIDPRTGRPRYLGKPTWTSVFADEITAIGAQRSDVVCVTAAMLHPTGLDKFAARFPDRIFDVGIAEQHAVTSAAGLAIGGLHPVVALYSTFVNRAFDQLLMDVALHRLPVTLVLDRAGITGPDGPSHHGKVVKTMPEHQIVQALLDEAGNETGQHRPSDQQKRFRQTAHRI
jgi:1-deoxy-D-xylulose-5-phosphate synthase